MRFTPAFCLLLFLFIKSNFLIAQTPQVNWGPALNNKSFGGGVASERKIISTDGNGLFIQHRNYLAKDFYLERYDKGNNLVFSKELKLPAKTKGNIEKVYMLNNTLMLLVSGYDKEADAAKITAFEISKETGDVLPTSYTLVSLSGVGSKDFSYRFETSPDKTKLLVLLLMPDKVKASRTISMALFDNGMKPVWSKAINLPEKYKVSYVRKFKPDNAGNAHLIIHREKGSKENKKNEPKWVHCSISYFPQKDQVRELDVAVPGKYIQSIELETDVTNQLNIVGLLQDHDSNNFLYSAYWSAGPESQNFDKHQVSKFLPDFLTEYNLLYGNKDGAERGIQDLEIRKIIPVADGNFTVLTEKQYGVDFQMANEKTLSNTCFGDIIVINLSTNGNINWMKSIPKYQGFGSQATRYLSFATLIDNDRIHLLFNDHAENVNNSEKAKEVGLLPLAVTAGTTILPDGTIQRKTWFPAAHEGTVFVPEVLVQDGKRIYIFMHGLTWSKYRIGTLNL